MPVSKRFLHQVAGKPWKSTKGPENDTRDTQKRHDKAGCTAATSTSRYVNT